MDNLEMLDVLASGLAIVIFAGGMLLMFTSILTSDRKR